MIPLPGQRALHGAAHVGPVAQRHLGPQPPVLPGELHRVAFDRRTRSSMRGLAPSRVTRVSPGSGSHRQRGLDQRAHGFELDLERQGHARAGRVRQRRLGPTGRGASPAAARGSRSAGCAPAAGREPERQPDAIRAQRELRRHEASRAALRRRGASSRSPRAMSCVERLGREHVVHRRPGVEQHRDADRPAQPVGGGLALVAALLDEVARASRR